MHEIFQQIQEAVMETLQKGCNTASLCKAVWSAIIADAPTLNKLIKDGFRISTTQFISELSVATYKKISDMLIMEANWSEEHLTFLPDEEENHVIIATKIASAHIKDTYNVYFHVDK